MKFLIEGSAEKSLCNYRESIKIKMQNLSRRLSGLKLKNVLTISSL